VPHPPKKNYPTTFEFIIITPCVMQEVLKKKKPAWGQGSSLF